MAMWVVATLSLITFLVGSLQAAIIVPHFVNELPFRTEDAIYAVARLLLPFNLGAAGILWNYYLCVTLDPGRVPAGWCPPQIGKQKEKTGDDEGEDEDGEDDEDDSSEEEAPAARFCRHCRAFKPPRAHHCKKCKRCVLRMDHHCPWVANCIGQRNYASFIRFLFFVDVTCIMHLTLLTARVADWWWLRMTGSFWRTPSTWTMVWVVLNYALCVPTLLFVGIFSLYHFWCLCSNTTTIEGAELDRVDRMIRRGRIRHVDYPFDLGMVRNIASVFGWSPLAWCLPRASRGDGLSFEVGEGLDELSQYEWPPPDPNHAVRNRVGPDWADSGYAHDQTALESRRQGQVRQRHPPWHPDHENAIEDDDSESDDDRRSTRIRRGSEGYEVRGGSAMMLGDS